MGHLATHTTGHARNWMDATDWCTELGYADASDALLKHATQQTQLAEYAMPAGTEQTQRNGYWGT
jgi:hypothetical protein